MTRPLGRLVKRPYSRYMWSKEPTMDSTTSSTLPASSSTPSRVISTEECYINRLPVELLAAILEEHSVQEEWAPLIASQVCRRWRETTQLWPRVWSYITVRSINERLITFTNRVKTFLERSRDSPLHIEYFSWVAKPSTVIFQLPTIIRIQNLILEGPLPDAVWMENGMPNLRSLELRQCDWRRTMFQLGAEKFPLLDEFVARGMWSIPSMVMGSPALLRTLSFSYIRHMEWVNILSECRETLVEVLLHRCGLPPPTQIHLPKLRFLALSNMLDFRSDIVAPGLTTFHERHDRLDSLKLPFNFSSITEYACQGGFPSVDDEPFSEGRVLANLERLALWGTWRGIRGVMWKLVSYPKAVPKLSAIELAAEDGDDLDDVQWAELENLFANTPLSSTLKRRTDSRASYVPLRFSLVRGSPWRRGSYSDASARPVGVS